MIPGDGVGPEVVRESRRVRLTRVVGLVLGVVAAVVVWAVGSFGLGAVLAPAAFGLCVVLATALGETVVRRPRPTGVRAASLRPRRVRDYVPPVLGGVVALVLLASVALMVLTTSTASRDPETDTVRALSCEVASGGSAATPYPGSYYTLPLAGLLVAVLLVAAVASRQVILRPRGLSLDRTGAVVRDDGGDDALRRRSLDVIVSAVGIAVCAPYVGMALTAGGALANLDLCAAGWMHPVGRVLLVSALVALVTGCVCLVRLLTGAPSAVEPAVPRG